MEHDALELAFGEPSPLLPVVIDQVREGPTLAVLVLDVDVAVLDPGVVVPHDVLVLHQCGVSEHLVHGDSLLVTVPADLVSGHL